ncbi:MAG: dipeptidase [Candidatus Kapaibacterium sp.]|jgi:microsomal dipeptidase-like Zn-dependent dipeptidase
MIPIIDIHCHPSLKTYLNEKVNLCKKNIAPSDIFPLGVHVDFPAMYQGNVRTIVASHYIPEYGFLQLKGIKRFARLCYPIVKNILEKFEQNNSADDAWEKLQVSIRNFVVSVSSCSEYDILCAKNYKDFKNFWDNGKTIILQSVEGAHHLGRNIQGKNAAVDDYTNRLSTLAEQGMCMLTLAHFFDNEVCGTSGGIAPCPSNLLGYSYQSSLGLTSIGTEVVKKALELGIIIDLMHTNRTTRREVYRITREYNSQHEKQRPIVFSHTGIWDLYRDGSKSRTTDYEYMPDKEDIKAVIDTKGVFGIILMNYWLVGEEEANIPFIPDNGIPTVIETIQCIYTLTGSYDNIAIGTDFDGFTDVPDDLNDASKLSTLSTAIESEFGTQVAEQIFYKNALRILENGWGK